MDADYFRKQGKGKTHWQQAGGSSAFSGAKNVAFIFIRKSRYTKEFIDNGETFSMTFFDKKYKNV